VIIRCRAKINEPSECHEHSPSSNPKPSNGEFKVARAKSTIFQCSRAVFVMAEVLAARAVKQKLYASGVRVNQVAMSEIKALARGYVLNNPEIIAEAKVICEELHQRELLKRARQRWLRQMKRCANLASAAPKSEPCTTTIIPVQQSRSKVEA